MAGKSQVTTGIRIQGKKEAAYEPVISKSPKRVKYAVQDYEAAMFQSENLNQLWITDANVTERGINEPNPGKWHLLH